MQYRCASASEGARSGIAYSGGSTLQPEAVAPGCVTKVRLSVGADDMGCGSPRALLPRDNRSLDVAVAVQHVTQDMLQTRQWRLTSDVVRAFDFLLRNQRECFAHGLRSVMESGLQREFVIVQPLGIKRDLGSIGATAKEVHDSALAHHVDRPLPR